MCSTNNNKSTSAQLGGLQVERPQAEKQRKSPASQAEMETLEAGDVEAVTDQATTMMPSPL